ncbi:MAG: phage head-tail adapter protein [Planctomycetia bacterium]|nr:phage head-tail adapter protein [Planctomycetia bacterium]
MFLFKRLTLLLLLINIVASQNLFANDFPNFIILPDYVSTPDGMVVCPETGDLLVACPNFGDISRPACVIRINQAGEVSKWFEVPVLDETGVAHPMGIDLGPDGTVFLCDNQNWPTGNGENGELNQGRLLRLTIKDNKVAEIKIVAEGFSHPNGVKIRDGFAYVTVSCLPKIKFADYCRQTKQKADSSELLLSAVYRFPIDAQNIKITNTLADKNIYAIFPTLNKDCQYGADGIVFDKNGQLYIGNFGDGTILKIVENKDKNQLFPASVVPFAKCQPIPPLNKKDGTPDEHFLDKATKVAMRTVDGICYDPTKGDFYVADFSNNAIAKVDSTGKEISFFAQSSDNDGLKGELNQPGEPCLWNGRLAVTCFDMVCDADKVNSKHDKKATIVFLPLN